MCLISVVSCLRRMCVLSHYVCLICVVFYRHAIFGASKTYMGRRFFPSACKTFLQCACVRLLFGRVRRLTRLMGGVTHTFEADFIVIPPA